MEKDIMDLAHRIKVAVLAEVGEDYDQMLESRVSAVDFVTQEIAEDFISSDSDYWTRLEHQAAIAAMQGMLNNSLLITGLLKVNKSHEDIVAEVTGTAIRYAHALVEKYKKEE